MRGQPRKTVKRKGSMLMNALRRIVSIFAIAMIATVNSSALGRADEKAYSQMKAAMRIFAPMVGTWNAVWRFYDKDGVTDLPGTETISYTLDGAYLERHEDHLRKDSQPHYALVIFTTFNPVANRFEQTYFYRSWPHSVTEFGVFDKQLREFRTETVVPREDGIHDEHVRTVLKIVSHDRMIYTHYSRYSNEPRERRNLVITLTRIN